MSRPNRHLPRPGSLVEVTVRTARGRLLFRPSRALNRIFVGYLGRALELYPVRLHAISVLSNHFHLLISPENSQQMARFMGHLNANLSKSIGRLHDWSGPMFARRYDAIPVSDEPEAQIARLDYLLRQGCKEGLVASPRDWPGVQSAAALCDGGRLRGTWISRTEYWRARNRGEAVAPEDFGTEYEVALEPLPCWEHLSDSSWRGSVRSMVEAIERETLALHRSAGTQPLGRSAILRRSPHDRPLQLESTPAPRVHAFRRSVRLELLTALRQFSEAYRAAADALRRGMRGVIFPGDCFPPSLPYVPPDLA